VTAVDKDSLPQVGEICARDFRRPVLPRSVLDVVFCNDQGKRNVGEEKQEHDETERWTCGLDPSDLIADILFVRPSISRSFIIS